MNENLLDQNNQDLPPQLDQSRNYLADLVGPDKKFKTVEDLARGKAEADTTIELFKKRQDELRTDYLNLREEANAQAKLQDLIDRLENPQNTPVVTPPVMEQKQPTVDPTQLSSLVSKEIVTYETNKKRTENYNQVQSKLQEMFGTNYQQELAKRMNTLGLTADHINETAKTSPHAFYNLMGLNQPVAQGFQSPIRSSVSNDNFSARPQKRTWAYYQEMKKADPKMYYNTKIANQMLDDMVELGDAFKDGDFNH